MKLLLATWVLELATGSTDQDWFGRPSLPDCFTETQDEEPTPPKPRLPSDAPSLAESAFPSTLSIVDLDAWRRQDELRWFREFASDAMLRLPLLIPQLLLEEMLPRGLAVGPTTYLYRSSTSSSAMGLIVLDQAMFHETEFLERLQAAGDDPYYSNLFMHGQRYIIRRSLMGGFRATYSLPSMTMNLLLETTADQGAWGYALAPVAAGALIYMKGLDQKFTIEKGLKARVVVAPGRDWLKAVDRQDALPMFSIELQVADLPVSLIASMEMSKRGMAPAFLGVGTSLDVVEDLLGREENRARRPNE